MSQVQVTTVTTKVTKKALVDFFHNPEIKVKDFLSQFTLGDGRKMSKSDLIKLLEQIGLNFEDRPTKTKTVYTFEIVDDEEVNPEETETNPDSVPTEGTPFELSFQL